MVQTAVAEQNCAECPIRERAVCAKCDTDELQVLEEIKYYRNYQAGHTICWAGDEMGFVASVVRGAATLSQTMEGRAHADGRSAAAVGLHRSSREKLVSLRRHGSKRCHAVLFSQEAVRGAYGLDAAYL